MPGHERIYCGHLHFFRLHQLSVCEELVSALCDTAQVVRGGGRDRTCRGLADRAAFESRIGLFALLREVRDTVHVRHCVVVVFSDLPLAQSSILRRSGCLLLDDVIQRGGEIRTSVNAVHQQVLVGKVATAGLGLAVLPRAVQGDTIVQTILALTGGVPGIFPALQTRGGVEDVDRSQFKATGPRTVSPNSPCLPPHQ